MATLDDVRVVLGQDELDYPALAASFGPDVLPQLAELVAEDDPRIAPKATYLAGLVAGADATADADATASAGSAVAAGEVLALAARSRFDVTRVAAATALQFLPAEQATPVADRLLGDPDMGVRAYAVRSAVQVGGTDLTDRVRQIAQEDAEEPLRALAADLTVEG